MVCHGIAFDMPFLKHNHGHCNHCFNWMGHSRRFEPNDGDMSFQANFHRRSVSLSATAISMNRGRREREREGTA